MRPGEQHSWKKHIYNTRLGLINSLPDRLRRMSSDKNPSPPESLTSSARKFRKNVVTLQRNAVQELSFGDKIKEINQPAQNQNAKLTE